MAINYKVVPLLKSFQEIISPTIITYKGKLFKIYSMFEHISTRRKFMKIKVLFICHGNICRSPMAEFIMKDRVKKEGLEETSKIISEIVENVNRDLQSYKKITLVSVSDEPLPTTSTRKIKRFEVIKKYKDR